MGPNFPVPRKAGPYAFDNAVRRPVSAGSRPRRNRRGACAGPLYAAAVVLGPTTGSLNWPLQKLLTAAVRERVEVRIKRSAVAWAVVAVDVEELDEVGLHHARTC